jgi:hypothetical protein
MSLIAKKLSGFLSILNVAVVDVSDSSTGNISYEACPIFVVFAEGPFTGRLKI